jgi:hypothetical protein
MCVCVCVYTNIWSVCNHLFPHHIWILSTMFDDKRIVERSTRRLGHITRHPAVKPPSSSSSSSCCHYASVGRINRPIVRGLTATTYSPQKKPMIIRRLFHITNGRSIYPWKGLHIIYGSSISCIIAHAHPSILSRLLFLWREICFLFFKFLHVPKELCYLKASPQSDPSVTFGHDDKWRMFQTHCEKEERKKEAAELHWGVSVSLILTLMAGRQWKLKTLPTGI